MRHLRTLATTAVLALALADPLLAQRGQSGGNRGAGSRPDGGSRQAQPRDSASVVDRTLDSGRRSDTGTPTLPGLGSASLITPRPGVDAFRADPNTYGSRDRVIRPRGPSWGGVPVSSAPSWGGTPVFGSNHDKDKWDHDGDNRGGGRRRGSWRGSRGVYTGGYGVIYGLPYGYMPYGVAQPGVPGQVTDVAPAQAEIPEGFLRLLVTPREAQVIVDGVVAGTVDDFGGGREQALSAGPHRIRIEAPGYEPVEFDVRVPAGDTISLRRELIRLPAAPPTPERGTTTQAPATRKTFYAIPNCYLGDSVPKADTLPPGCSLKDMRVLPPQ